MTTDSDYYCVVVLVRLTFLCEQISLLIASKMNYSPHICYVFTFCCISHCLSHSERECSELRKCFLFKMAIVYGFSLSGRLNENSHITYLKQKAEIFEDNENMLSCS